jgi:palmitoyl-protein thioesterase
LDDLKLGCGLKTTLPGYRVVGFVMMAWMWYTPMLIILLFIVILISGRFDVESTRLLLGEKVPVVLWHGMGDSCANNSSMKRIISLIESYDIKVYCISSPGYLGDVAGSFIGNVDEQIDKVCQNLKESLGAAHDGYIGIGFSQGGLFMRALLQKCDEGGPRMKVLISLGGPQGGVASLPGCPVGKSTPSYWCSFLESLVGGLAYTSIAQDTVVQAQYLYNPGEFTAPFLEDMNAVRSGCGEHWTQYRRRILEVDTIALFSFSEDDMLEPPQSSHFGYFNGSEIVALEDQPGVYRCLGFGDLVKSGRLHLHTLEGAKHMQFSLTWFDQHVIQPYILDYYSNAIFK